MTNIEDSLGCVGDELEVGEGLFLQRRVDGLTLTDGTLEMRGDLTRMLPRLAPGKLSGELLVRAAKIRDAGERPVAIDATAGLGEDALLLAAAGFCVELYESDPVIAALLRDALVRATTVPELADAVARMRVYEADSIAALPAYADAEHQVAVVYLDPMFPASRKSAAAKKKFQLLRQLECPEERQEAMVRAALAAQPHKVVIKRPLKGPNLADIKPAYSLKGKAIRYDCLVLPPR